MWQIETYDTKTKSWRPMGTATADFHGIWKKVGKMSANGYKVRIKKQPDKAPETPEQKMPAGETPEDKAGRLGCTFSAPFDCEYCDRKRCPVTVDDIRRAQEEPK